MGKLAKESCGHIKKVETNIANRKNPHQVTRTCFKISHNTQCGKVISYTPEILDSTAINFNYPVPDQMADDGNITTKAIANFPSMYFPFMPYQNHTSKKKAPRRGLS
jgi:hypothetical protein